MLFHSSLTLHIFGIHSVINGEYDAFKNHIAVKCTIDDTVSDRREEIKSRHIFHSTLILLWVVDP